MTRIFFAIAMIRLWELPFVLSAIRLQSQALLNIHDLHVRGEFGRIGIGSALIDAVVDYTKSIDGCAVTLEVRRDNPARVLYTQKGFQTHGEPYHTDAMLFGKRFVYWVKGVPSRKSIGKRCLGQSSVRHNQAMV